MHTVDITLRATDLSSAMIAMREWLDDQGCEPSKFTFDQDGDTVVISVSFTTDPHGEAFAARFNGRSSARHRSRR
jgi:hypothetical protein